MSIDHRPIEFKPAPNRGVSKSLLVDPFQDFPMLLVLWRCAKGFLGVTNLSYDILRYRAHGFKSFQKKNYSYHGAPVLQKNISMLRGVPTLVWKSEVLRTSDFRTSRLIYPLQDFLKANPWPHPRPDQRQKTLRACGPSGFWTLVWPWMRPQDCL